MALLGLLLLASDHVIVVAELSLEVGVQVVGHGLLLKLDGSDTALLLSEFQVLEPLESLLLKLVLGVTKLGLANKLHSELSLLHTDSLSQFDLLLHVLLVELFADAGLLLSVALLNVQVGHLEQVGLVQLQLLALVVVHVLLHVGPQLVQRLLVDLEVGLD